MDHSEETASQLVVAGGDGAVGKVGTNSVGIVSLVREQGVGRAPRLTHDTRALQAYLGHKNIQHTVRYTELAPTRFMDFWR
jgi:hypothetical protein